MTSSAVTKKAPVADLVKMECDENYNRDVVSLMNKPLGSTAGTALTVNSPMGQPVMAGNDAGKTIFAAALGASVATGLYLDPRPITALGYSSSLAYGPLILARGPAIVLQSAIPAYDVAGATITMATLITRLATLGIIVRSGSTYETNTNSDPNA